MFIELFSALSINVFPLWRGTQGVAAGTTVKLMFIELFASAQNLIANRGTGYRKAMSLRGGIYADVAISSITVPNIWEFGAKRRL